MTAPRRLIDEANDRADQVIARAASVAPQPMRADGWDDVMAAALTRGPNTARLVPAFLFSFLLGVAVVLLLRPQREAAVIPANVTYATAGSRWSTVAPDEVALESGRLFVTTPSGAPLRVRTPHAVLEVTRSRFLAEVVAGETRVQVEEGEVVLRSGGVTRSVRAGDSLTWPPLVAIPEQLLEAAPAPGSRCGSLALGERQECLRLEAADDSLQSQAALYELGSFEAKQGELEAGLRTWRESLARFPEGVLHPEVRLAVLIELIRARRFADAREAALDFEAHCTGDPRRGDVEALRSQLP